MARLWSTYKEMVTRFDESINALLEKLLYRNFPLITWAKAGEPISEELSLSYLDLAMPSPTHGRWRKRLRTLYLRDLPHLCMEHLLAERVSRRQRIQGLYSQMVSYHFAMVQILCNMLDMFDDSWFDPYEEAIKNKIPELADAQKMQKIRSYLAVLQRSSSPLHKRMESMLPTLLEHSTNLHPNMTKEILDTFCVTRAEKLRLFSVVTNVQCLVRLIFQAKVMRFNFWGLWSGKGDSALNLMDLKQENSMVLLQYDFPYRTDQATFLRRCICVNNIRVRDRRIIQSLVTFTKYADSEKRTRIMLIMDIFITFGNFDIATNFNDRVNTLLYLTRTLPLPYVTTRELYETMLKAVVPEFRNDVKEIASKYGNIDIFEDDVNDPIMPRRLMHLCRVAIRRVLADNFVHVDGIDQLRLPRLLKEYLKLEK